MSESPSIASKLAMLPESQQIEHFVAIAQEEAAYKLVKKAEEHLQRCMDNWEEACTRVRMTAPQN